MTSAATPASVRLAVQMLVFTSLRCFIFSELDAGEGLQVRKKSIQMWGDFVTDPLSLLSSAARPSRDWSKPQTRDGERPREPCFPRIQ